ncbi:LAME_0D00848g1_1 [Lachancea meyersii CBS 8951]|uniref:Mediator of RNA polymerase II transcription subunit 17 n=1 Tax=Lachancea meyersii CBS 8951 TaxID=1266667 RepID=A0A1G4J633_9SACH|nr:LAME_0D00848g1_1 [Lachancea meyersii CBS 8951]
MTDSSSHQSSDLRSDGNRRIPLAIDPNFIRPIPSTVSPSNNEPDDSDKTQNGIQDAPLKGQSLISNPYELFGGMPLDQLIPIILQSRGAGSKFADLSEDVLLDEIAKETGSVEQQKSLDDNANVDNSAFVENLDEEALKPQQIEEPLAKEEEKQMTQEQFQQLRASTVQSLNLSLNESSLALEFVSLLLSSVRPSAASASMSPFLKKTVPAASLNAEKIPFEKPKESEAIEKGLVTRGWKLRSLEESRLLLKDTHRALEASLMKEQNYWSKVSRHTSKKDVIFKMRDQETGEKSLGLKYGYEDSGSTYTQERGIAILKYNSIKDSLEAIPSGKQQVQSMKKGIAEKFMRVRIFTRMKEEDDYILSGETALDDLLVLNSNTSDEHDIRRQISKLQFLIFEKELMFHLKKESESLISYGVTIENENKITVEFPTEKMEFEMMSLTDEVIMNHQQDAPKTNDKKASLVLVMLRMLLVTMFKKQIKKELLMAAPQKPSRTFDSEALLLRPIIGKFRHENYLSLLQKVIKAYILDVVDNSTVTQLPSTRRSSSKGADGDVYDKHITKLDEEIGLFDRILQLPRTELKVQLPSSGRIEFGLESSNYCNATTSVKFDDASNVTVFDTKFSNFKELEDFLHFIVSEYVTDSKAQD